MNLHIAKNAFYNKKTKAIMCMGTNDFTEHEETDLSF